MGGRGQKKRGSVREGEGKDKHVRTHVGRTTR